MSSLDTLQDRYIQLFLPLVSIAVHNIAYIIKRHIRTLQVPYVLYVLVIIATHPKGNRRRNIDLGCRNAEVKF